MLGTRDILVRIRIGGSVLWLMDPDPDPTPFFGGFKDTKKINTFIRKRKDLDPEPETDPYLWLMDVDSELEAQKHPDPDPQHRRIQYIIVCCDWLMKP